MTPAWLALAVGAAWGGAAVALGLLIGRIARDADCCPCCHADLDDLLADQPISVVDAEFYRITDREARSWYL